MSRISNTAGLEGLVVGPYRWSAVTYSSFLRDAYDNVIKTEVERLQNIQVEKRKQADLAKREGNDDVKGSNLPSTNQNYDVKIARLVQSLIEESGEVLDTENWTDIIGPELWNILKLDENGKDRYKLDNEKDDSAALKKKSVVQLLKFIRNKISHIRTINNDMKEKLTNIFEKDDNNKYKFNENKFVAFWISKFPKLVPHLWLKLYKFKDKLVNYYPDYEIEIGRVEDFLLDLNKLVIELKSALIADMENGNLVKRFKGLDYTLEFRELHNLFKIIDKVVYFKVIANSKGKLLLSVSHSSTNDDRLEYLGTAPGSDNLNLVLIFAKNIMDDKVWKYCNNCDCRVIVFCEVDKLTNEKMEEAVDKFRKKNNLLVELSESSIIGNELSIEKQEWVYKEGELCIQNKIMKIADIFPGSIDIVEGLSGDLLNKLLRQEKPIPFANYIYPQYKGVYIQRKLYFRSQNLFPSFRVEWLNIVINASKETLLRFVHTERIQEFKNVDHLCREKESVKQYCNIILLTEPIEITPKMVDECQVTISSRVLCFRDFKDKWARRSFCRFASQQDEPKVELGENEFLEKIFSKSIKAVCIHARSGMGKSKLLLSLGKNLINSLVIICSIRQFLDTLIVIIGKRECSKLDIKSIILEILGCKDDCEKYLVDKWLERKYNNGIKMELQLDGLDEIPGGNLKLALRALEIINQEFDTIRLWITSSKSFRNKMMNIQTTYCCLCPFSHEDKISFFRESWSKKCVKFTDRQLEDIICELLTQCLTFSNVLLPGNFTDSPLNCSMLAELYEDKYTELTPFNGSAMDLYYELYKKRFAIMYKKIYGFVDETSGNFKLLRENYLQLHTYIALTHLFDEVSCEFVRPLAIKFLNKGDYCKMGIIRGIRPDVFLHLTYAYFFVAQFIVKVLETGEFENLCSKETFENLLYFGSPDKNSECLKTSLWMFVEKYLENEADYSSLNWFKTHQKHQHPFFMQNKMSRFISDALEFKMWNLVKFLIKLWVDERDTTVCNQILHLALSKEAPSNWFIRICEQLRFDNQIELVICSVENGRYEVARYLIENWCGDDVFDRIAEVKVCGGGIFHCITHQVRKPYKWMESEGFLEENIQFIKYIHERNGEEIKRKDNRGLTLPLELTAILNSIEESESFDINYDYVFFLKKFLTEYLKADINETPFD